MGRTRVHIPLCKNYVVSPAVCHRVIHGRGPNCLDTPQNPDQLCTETLKEFPLGPRQVLFAFHPGVLFRCYSVRYGRNTLSIYACVIQKCGRVSVPWG